MKVFLLFYFPTSHTTKWGTVSKEKDDVQNSRPKGFGRSVRSGAD